MPLDTSSSPGPDLPPEWAAAFEQVCPPTSVDIGIDINRPEVARVLTWPERRERLKKLHSRLITIDRENPAASPDFIQVEKLYSKNLIPNEAFLALEHDDHRTFTLASERGGMLHHFQPSEEEIDHYPDGYETVREQVIRDLIGGPDSPGEYRMIGLFDDNEILRASLSYRLPPKMPSTSEGADEYVEKMARYRQYLCNSLLDPYELKSKQMIYEARWKKPQLVEQFADLWEIDTFNVDLPDWKGAGYLVLQSALDQIRAERGELPEAVFCYRFSGIRRLDPETKQKVLVGPNRGSRSFLENLGFHDMADKALRKEVVVRTMPDGHCHQYNPEWKYLHNGRNRLQRQLTQHLLEMGLMTEKPKTE